VTVFTVPFPQLVIYYYYDVLYYLRNVWFYSLTL
jgi:hypothetical protein